MSSSYDTYSVDTPSLEWKDNLYPYSERYKDIYYPPHYAVEQSSSVFLEGNHIPHRWKAACSPSEKTRCVIGELGFGVGVNFLLTLKERKQSLHTPKRLFYISTEQYPLRKEDLERALSAFPDLKEEASLLLQSYPPPLRGSHRIHFPCHNTTLDLIFGDANESLHHQQFIADAWYLDGFNPKSNDSLWNKNLFEILRTHSHSETTLATYSSAGWVRRLLESVGCTLKKIPHAGGKRETLTGIFSSAPPKPPLQSPSSISIMGAGLAGVVLSDALARRDIAVSLYERESSICTKASGNPRGVILPYITRKPSIQSELYLSSYLYSLQFFTQLAPSLVNTPGILHFPSTERLQSLMERLANLKVPEGIASRLSATEVSEKLGLPIPSEAFFYPKGSWISPKQAAEEILTQRKNQIILHTDSGTTPSGEYPVIYSNAYEARDSLQGSHLPLEPVRGQIAIVDETAQSHMLRHILCYNGYFIPSLGGTHLIGATYEHNSLDAVVRPEENLGLLKRLSTWIPAYDIPPTNITSSRVAFRTSTRDRLPIIGPSRFSSALFFVGFGSRGITSIPLLAEHLASMLVGDPLPLPTHLERQVSVARVEDHSILPANENTRSDRTKADRF